MEKTQAEDVIRSLYPVEEITEQMMLRFREILGELTEQEERVFALSHGLEGQPLFIETIAKEYQIDENVVRKTEQMARRKLRHPLRMNYVIYGQRKTEIQLA